MIFNTWRKKIPVSLVATGDWTNTQYYGGDVDPTGLTFTVTYNFGDTKEVTPTISGGPWGVYTSATARQDAVFSYEENGKTVFVILTVITYRVLTSLTVTGDWEEYSQFNGSAPDTTGLTFTATFNNGQEETVTPSISLATWPSTGGEHTATFSYTERDFTVSTTKVAYMTYSITTAVSPTDIVLGSISINDNQYTYSPSASQTRTLTTTIQDSTNYRFTGFTVSGGNASAPGTSIGESTLTINSGSTGDISITANFVTGRIILNSFIITDNLTILTYE